MKLKLRTLLQKFLKKERLAMRLASVAALAVVALAVHTQQEIISNKPQVEISENPPGILFTVRDEWAYSRKFTFCDFEFDGELDRVIVNDFSGRKEITKTSDPKGWRSKWVPKYLEARERAGRWNDPSAAARF